MNQLQDIIFFQVYKRKGRSKKKPYIRKVTKTTLFEEKAKVIKMRAEEINYRLINQKL